MMRVAVARWDGEYFAGPCSVSVDANEFPGLEDLLFLLVTLNFGVVSFC